MNQRDTYIPGVPCWVDTDQPDPYVAVEFYRGLFGWEFEERSPDDMLGTYHVALLRGRPVAGVGTKQQSEDWPTAWNTYISVENADQAAAKVRDAGGTVLMDAFDIGKAGRMAVVADPEGAAFNLWQPVEMIGAELVNEPGTLNFNDLNTRDPERAKAFYGSVFGWGTLDLGGGSAMWTLPGYGDHLEQIDPGVRRQHAELGAPAGFTDVVATLTPIGEDQAQTAPHWGISFSVEDADMTAERAAELGGEVVVPPFDVPWVRMTVIADPQGAAFTAGKFVPDTELPAGNQGADSVVRPRA